jgi:hypothetical protein
VVGELDTQAIVGWRLQSQQLVAPPLHAAEDVVSSLGGVQAQDARWAKWSIGLRMQNATEATIDQAIANRQIVRTWAFRGTLHWIAAADVGWLIALLAPTIIAANRRRYRQLELDEQSFEQSSRVIEKALAGGEQLTRAQLAASLEAEGMSAKGQRAPYVLQHAALEGLICHGPPQGREPTYVLLADWVQPGDSLPRDEALARLAERYFASHGPAQLQDLSWWSGLPAADGRQSLASARSSLVRMRVEGKELWAGHERQPSDALPGAHLLPPFDEYLLGYKDRTLAVEPGYARRVNAGGGMPRPAILVNGKVAGVWKPTTRDNVIQVAAELFYPLDERETKALQEAAHRFGAFRQAPVEMVPHALN